MTNSCESESLPRRLSSEFFSVTGGCGGVAFVQSSTVSDTVANVGLSWTLSTGFVCTWSNCGSGTVGADPASSASVLGLSALAPLASGGGFGSSRGTASCSFD